MSSGSVRTSALMGTVVTIEVVGSGVATAAKREETIDRAFAWFERIEADCSRFVKTSELRKLCATFGAAVPVSELLFNAVRFAIAVAEETDGAFDPTVGFSMEERGFDREHRSGAKIDSGSSKTRPLQVTSFRDVKLNAKRRTVELKQPLLLDLGAIAKGLAIDMAAQELRPLGNFSINAGGDLYLGGKNQWGQAWSVGIRNPRATGEMIETIAVSNMAVCTSGDYERRTPDGDGHHILDPRTGQSADGLASVTVVAPSAMVADGLATAAFVLGPHAGMDLLARHGVGGLLITPRLKRFETGNLSHV